MNDAKERTAVSGPYIVSLVAPPWTEHDEDLGAVADVYHAAFLLSRVAVGSLEEAKAWLRRNSPNGEPGAWKPFYDASDAILEPGGPVDLPDGTRVTVQTTMWADLLVEFAVKAGVTKGMTQAEWQNAVLAAWNAEHGR